MILHLTSYILHPTSYILQPTSYILHPTSYISPPADTGATWQFFITTAAAPHLNHKHVVVGRVLSGMDAIRQVRRRATQPGP